MGLGWQKRRRWASYLAIMKPTAIMRPRVNYSATMRLRAIMTPTRSCLAIMKPRASY